MVGNDANRNVNVHKELTMAFLQNAVAFFKIYAALMRLRT